MNLIYFIIISIILGQIFGQLNKKLPQYANDDISYTTFKKNILKGFNIDIIFSVLIFLVLYILNMKFGYTLEFYKYSLTIIPLILVFSIDLKHEIIPDELVMLLSVFAMGFLIYTPNNWLDLLLGSLAGGGCFYLLGLLGVLLFKKDGMGFGDVKLMIAIGLVFGLKATIVITLLSFFLAAIISIIVVALKVRKMDEYIPFGPFIVIATIVLAYYGSDKIIEIYININQVAINFVFDNLYKIVSMLQKG